MHALRNARTLARLVLVWFALSIGVAVASPLVKPQAMELVCSGSGVMKVLVKTDDGVKEVSSHTLDCPLCANLTAPPPAAAVVPEPAHPLAYALGSLPAAHIASLIGAPWQARAPPSR